MDDWQKNFFETLETVANEVEKFFLEMTEEAVEALDSFLEFSEEVTQQAQHSFFNDLEQFLNELVDPIVDIYLEVEQFDITEQPEQFVHYVEPTIERQKACQGCRNYHGYVYGGNLLVCGMHPYGWEDENCPDWEGY